MMTLLPSQRAAADFAYYPSLSPFTVSQQTYLETQPDAPYSHLATGSMVFDHSEPSAPRILLVQRSETDSMPGRWEIPGGACDDDDESILHAAVRELREETGLQAARIGPQVGPGNFFTSRSGKQICRFTFIVAVKLDDRKGRPAVELDPNEHQQYVWATRQEVEARSCESKLLEFTTPDLETALRKREDLISTDDIALPRNAWSEPHMLYRSSQNAATRSCSDRPARLLYLRLGFRLLCQ
ncbi:hypothetical protein BST61_g10630 [Cercospora zeina]